MAFTMIPAVALGQARRMPFSNYIIQLDETGMTSANANNCIQCPEAPSPVVLHNGGILRLAL